MFIQQEKMVPDRSSAKSTPALRYQYVWSLMDKLILATFVVLILFSWLAVSLKWIGLALFSLFWLACLIGLLIVRQRLFKPARVFMRMLDAVHKTVLNPDRVQNWHKWEDVNNVHSFAQLYLRANEFLDSMNDFYTCLLSPEPKRLGIKVRNLADSGLSFGMKRNLHGLLVFDANGNLLPEQDEKGNPCIASVAYGSLADKVELQPGDIVLAINGKPCTQLNLSELYRLGNSSKVDMRISRLRATREIKLNLSALKKKAIISSSILKGNVGYLRVERFDDLEVSLMKEHLKRISSCSGLILDLRGNRGGDLRRALQLASAFIEKGVLAYCKRRIEGGEVKTMRYLLGEQFIDIEVDYDKLGEFELFDPDLAIERLGLMNMPMVAIVDDYSMSGAELVAGALQHYRRAPILGRKTFGKGIGQDILSIPPCVKVSVTAMKFMTPSNVYPGDGAITECTGIQPDIVITEPSCFALGNLDDPWIAIALRHLPAATPEHGSP